MLRCAWYALRREKKTLVFSILMLLVMGMVSELTLQVLSWISPRAKELLARRHQPLEEIVKDARLGWRGNPKHPDHDPRGFRNKTMPQKVAIVPLGDSQTYGTNVAPAQAWPQQLENLGAITTYNMGIAGYGPPQSLLLLEEAINMQPKLIIAAFYSGNDLYDAYVLIYKQQVALPALKNTDESIIEIIAERERNAPLEQQRAHLYQRAHPEQQNQEREHLRHGAVREFLAEHSNLYGLMRAVKNAYSIYKYKKQQSFASDDWESVKQEVSGVKEYYQIFEYATFKTIFTSHIRLLALDMHDPRIREGHRICLKVFRVMRERTRAAEISFLVLLIPTKELVFKDLLLNKHETIPKIYQNLLENEELMWEKTKEFLLTHKIAFVDALPALRESLHTGHQPYPISWDGHPNEIGHRTIAALVLSAVGMRFQEEGLLHTQK